LLGCIKAPGRHCQTSASRTELIEQHIDAMLQQDVTDPEADDMDLVLSVDNISNNSLPEKAILSYLGGYVAHKLQRFSSCFDYVANYKSIKGELTVKKLIRCAASASAGSLLSIEEYPSYNAKKERWPVVNTGQS